MSQEEMKNKNKRIVQKGYESKINEKNWNTKLLKMMSQWLGTEEPPRRHKDKNCVELEENVEKEEQEGK